MPLVHVGYPKTASTWLQGQVFLRPDSGFHSIPPLEILEHLLLRDVMSFDVDAALRSFEPHLREARNRRLVPLLSNEILVGDPIQGGRYWGMTVAERLHQLFPSARILIVIREQLSMLLSSYRQHVRVGGTATLEGFVHRDAGFDAVCRLEFFEYDRMIATYQRLFGRQAVLVLPYELLRQSTEGFVEPIMRLVGLDDSVNVDGRAANRGWGAATIEVRRRLNRLVRGWTYFDGPQPPRSWTVANRVSWRLDRLVPRSIQERRERVLEDIGERVARGRFAASNHRTSQLIGIDLATLGYE